MYSALIKLMSGCHGDCLIELRRANLDIFVLLLGNFGYK